ncbi:MAG: VanZ family protein [Gammaproteobacteria bacterium]|nr:VanZ family protein [Gammaproteobacteria bacterium]
MLLKFLNQIPAPAWRLLAWLGVAVVLWVSLIRISQNIGFAQADKLVHMSMYASLMLCFSRGYARRLWPRVALSLAVMGASVEYLQSLTPYRSASLEDEIANLLGISIMLWLVRRAPDSAPANAPRNP